VNFGAQLVLVALASCVYPLLQVGEGGCVDGRTAVRPYDPLPRGNCAGRTAVRPYTPLPRGKCAGRTAVRPLPPRGREAGSEGKTQNGSTETDLATSASAIPNMPISPIPQKKPASSTGA
jgi:hypothetical protein